MCGRYIVVQKIEAIEQRFNVKAPEGLGYEPSFNVAPGKYAPVITNENPRELKLFRFGLTPFWAKKPMMLINARSEGDHNKENDPAYHGSKGIITKPSFRKPIRSQRCLIIADAFIEGTTKEKLSKPYLVYLRNKNRPFAFAGIWDAWKDNGNNELIYSFAIITTVANSLLQKIPHHRSPVILDRRDERTWLDTDAPLTDITSMLKPYAGELMNAYPISTAIKNPRNDSKENIQPQGKTIEPETGQSVVSSLELQGMGNPRKR